MSHTMQCYVDDGLAVVTAGWNAPGSLPIAPWSWGHQDSLYASLGPPGQNPMAGATELEDRRRDMAVFGVAAVAACAAAMFLVMTPRSVPEPLSSRYAPATRREREPWHVPDVGLLYAASIERAKAKTRDRAAGRH